MFTHLILFDGSNRDQLLPLTFTRPVGALRLGIRTIAEQWAHLLGRPVSFLTQDYLAPLFPTEVGPFNLLLNGSLLPAPEWITALTELAPGQAYTHDGELLAALLPAEDLEALIAGHDFGDITAFPLESPTAPQLLQQPADLFAYNDQALRQEFKRLTAGRSSAPLPPGNTLIGPTNQLFIEAGAEISASVLNVTTGPIYVAGGAKILEGCLLRGPVAIGEGSVLKMGAQIYGATTLGPHCKVGGEVNNVVLYGNSNKGHGGYLGNAVVGEWCNLGAGTNSSNLRNDYGNAKVWSYPAASRIDSGRQFHGLIMGDHSKVGINTMFNTASVVGVSANIFGAGFAPSFVPSFSWGGGQDWQTYRLDKALETAGRVMQRRGLDCDPATAAMLTAIFSETAVYRPNQWPAWPQQGPKLLADQLLRGG